MRAYFWWHVMQTFKWDEHFLTGIEQVDQRHHGLVDLINALGERLLDGELQRAELADLVMRLRHYTEQHFREEESLMRSRGLHPESLQTHIRAHRAFAEEVARFQGELQDMSDAQIGQLHDYLVHWLGYHILGVDLSMARQLDLMATGASAERAYAEEQARDAGPMQPLLDAVVGLLRIVESKNRELRGINASLESEVVSRTQELQQLSEAMRDLAMKDQLTGLPNRRRATDFLAAHWKDGRPLSCLMIDLDRFKQINDSRGHDAGDEALQRVAREIQANFRTDDLVCRIGGDEFLVLCPETPESDAVVLAETVRAAVEGLEIAAGDGIVTLSIGLASTLSAGASSPKDLLRIADQNLYGAKHGGRNAVSVRSTAT